MIGSIKPSRIVILSKLLPAILGLLFVSATFLSSNVLAGHELTQIQSSNYDIDDNIFVTPARIIIWNTVTQQEFGVTTADWALVKGLIGKEGPFKNFILRPDFLRYFGDKGPLGNRLLRMQFEKAYKSGNWKGPNFPALKESMGLPPERRKYISDITAREHENDTIDGALHFWVEVGELPNTPGKDNIYSVGAPGFPQALRGKDLAESKANVMKLKLDEIEKIAVPQDATLVENRDGTGQEKLHLWGFSDDDFGNVQTAINKLGPEVAAGRWPHIKVVIFFDGLNNPDQRPRAMVIKSDGTTRPTLPVEATRPVILTGLKSPEEAKLHLEDLAFRANAGKGKILIVLSSENKLLLKNGKTYDTGFYLNELGVPAKALVEAGYELVFANPKGNTPALDVTSDSPKYFEDEYTYNEVKDFYNSLGNKLQAPNKLEDVAKGGISQFAGIFIPGGHAPMTDLMADPHLGELLRDFHEAGKPTAIICHGPCALVSTVSDPVAYRKALVEGDFATAQKIAGDWIYKGYNTTVFSSTEDILGEPKLGGPVPFFPETVLQTAGANVEVGPQRKSHVRQDRELITGQNPQSDVALCKLFIEALSKKK